MSLRRLRCELEDLTGFLDGQLGSLELAIDNFRGTQDAFGREYNTTYDYIV